MLDALSIKLTKLKERCIKWDNPLEIVYEEDLYVKGICYIVKEERVQI